MATTESANPVIEDKSSPSTSGPDSESGSVEELPKEAQTVPNEGTSAATNGGDLTNKVSAGANYLGSVFSSAWAKTAKKANDATTSSSSFLTTAFSKVHTTSGNQTGNSPPGEEGEQPLISEDNEQEPNEETNISAFLSNAWSKVGVGFKANKDESSVQQENIPEEPIESAPEAPEATNNAEEQEASRVNFFTNFSSMVGKVANNATTVIKDKVSTSIIGEFNKQQDDFIKNKGPDMENGLPPWIGYQDEEAMKAKILALSQDKRNFVRAPPAGVTFEFDYASVSATALALIQEDPQLDAMRYELVPKRVKEHEFWRNYFYRVNLIKQSFDLKDLEQQQTSSSRIEQTSTPNDQEECVETINNHDHDDEFVSESYQASTEDINEVNASMKKLGVSGNENEEWEAELEGELNEFEMVNSKDGRGSEEDPEWENQIQQMLEAEDK